MQPIVSERHLASILGSTVEELRELARTAESHYEPIIIRDKKRPDKVRHLHVPGGRLKEIQSRIHHNILAKLPLARGVHGGVRGCSPRTNAEQHLGQACVVNLDVKSFFDEIRHYIVLRMFRRDLGFGRDVARLLTRLTTQDGRVPQGAPTSTSIANLVVAAPVDTPITAQAERLDVRYSRFVDDVTLSGMRAPQLISEVARALSRRRLSIHRPRQGAKSKLKVTWKGQAQKVTGLTVNSSDRPSVPKGDRSNIRAAIFELRSLQDGSARSRAVQSIRGRIAYVRPLNPGAAKHLDLYLNKTLAQPDAL